MVTGSVNLEQHFYQTCLKKIIFQGIQWYHQNWNAWFHFYIIKCKMWELNMSEPYNSIVLSHTIVSLKITFKKIDLLWCGILFQYIVEVLNDFWCLSMRWYHDTYGETRVYSIEKIINIVDDPALFWYLMNWSYLTTSSTTYVTKWL